MNVRDESGGAPTSLTGRSRELRGLRRDLDAQEVKLIQVSGPRGRGKTALLAHGLAGRRALHFQSAPLPGQTLVNDLTELTRGTLGEVPAPRRPGVLPFSSPAGEWMSLLMGIADSLEPEGEPLVLALDGADELLGQERRLTEALGEMMDAVRARELPLTLVLTCRKPDSLDPLVGEERRLGAADRSLNLSPLPFRAAGWAHGGTSPRDAFLRWALLGENPAFLVHNELISEEAASAVHRRVLSPDGDLWDAPIRRLERSFQRPGRYAAILRTLARGPSDWGDLLRRTPGMESGGQLAPYLQRLEEEGLVESVRPLGASPKSRNSRYRIPDPFLAFWFGWVLPVRSAITGRSPGAAWAELIEPTLDVHLQNALERAAELWLRDHAEEALGAPAREAGGLWGGEADFPVTGRLANGQVCYGLVEWSADTAGMAVRMVRSMEDTRYGIGRESRAPLFFLAREGDEEIRRMVARQPLARIIGLDTLMGHPEPENSSPSN